MTGKVPPSTAAAAAATTRPGDNTQARASRDFRNVDHSRRERYVEIAGDV